MANPTMQELAEKLTDAQRRAVLSGSEPDGRGKWPLSNALVGKGLARFYPWGLTPLGLQLRAALRQHLQGRSGGGEA